MYHCSNPKTLPLIAPVPLSFTTCYWVYHCSNPKTLPLLSAGPLSFATVHWATGIMYKAYKDGLAADDLFDIPWRDSSHHNAQR